MSRRKEPARCQDAITWLDARKHDLAGLTGQDVRAVKAIAHCWDLYAVGDRNGQDAAMGAVARLLDGMQSKYWGIAKELIAHSMDWGDRDRLWAELLNRFEPRTRIGNDRSSTSPAPSK